MKFVIMSNDTCIKTGLTNLCIFHVASAFRYYGSTRWKTVVACCVGVFVYPRGFRFGCHLPPEGIQNPWALSQQATIVLYVVISYFKFFNFEGTFSSCPNVSLISHGHILICVSFHFFLCMLPPSSNIQLGDVEPCPCVIVQGGGARFTIGWPLLWAGPQSHAAESLNSHPFIVAVKQLTLVLRQLSIVHYLHGRSSPSSLSGTSRQTVQPGSGVLPATLPTNGV